MVKKEILEEEIINDLNEPLVYLIGQDGADSHIQIPYRLATLSSTLVKFIENSNNTDTTSDGRDIYEVKLDGISTNILTYVKKYLEYKFENESMIKNSNTKASDAMLDIPDFEYPKDLSLELLMAADFLDI
ncbi:hypothetical protein QEN19_001387 [Hanseniaspora menglaensis]